MPTGWQFARQPRICAERLELVEAYTACARELGMSIHVLSNALMAGRYEWYARLHDAAETARRKTEQARLALELHTAERLQPSCGIAERFIPWFPAVSS